MSYYTKGSIVGLLLDARLRRLTKGARGLDDVMRAAYRRFSGGRGYTPADFRAVANEVGGADLGDFFHRALETTGELDYTEMLDWYGLRFSPPRRTLVRKPGSGSSRGWTTAACWSRGCSGAPPPMARGWLPTMS